MFARLILSLLLAAFALPAMAASRCHDAPAAIVMAPHHSMPATPGRDDGAIMAHACIGCIPPSSMEPRAIAHPMIPRDIVLVEIVSRFDTGRPAAPATPPPRTQA